MGILDAITGKGNAPEPPVARPEQRQSPANAPKTRVVDAKTRIPMTIPMQKLEVPEIEGYVLQWFADRPGRISRAQAGGYEFVSPGEIAINQFGLASDVLKDGNTDLGNQISIHGGTGENGQGERLFLMKIRREWWQADQQVIADRNESVAATIRRGGDVGPNPHAASEDSSKSYGGAQEERPARPRKKSDNMFTRKT